MASLSGWAEIAIISVLFVVITSTFIFGGMNTLYGKNYDTGLTQSGNQTISDLNDYQQSLEDRINTGEPEDSDNGLTIKTAWDMVKTGFTTIGQFIIGSWISNIIQLTGLPLQMAFYLRMLWLLGLGFVIIKILFKVVP